MKLKTQLIEELERYFGDDKKRIDHAKRVLKYSEMINAEEKGDEGIITAAAILHDIGIKAAEKKYGSAAGYLQEKEGPEIAEAILERLGCDQHSIDKICAIISKHHTLNGIDSIEFKIIIDADMLTNMIEEQVSADRSKIRRIYVTETGRAIAEKVLLKGEEL